MRSKAVLCEMISWSCFNLPKFCCIMILNFISTVDIDSACKKNKTAIVANPFNCAQYYDCSKKTSMFGKPYLQECKYPDLFSPITNSCQPFSSVTGKCGRRKEVQAPCKLILLHTLFQFHDPYLVILYAYKE